MQEDLLDRPQAFSTSRRPTTRGNSTERMLQLLRKVDPDEVAKIQCFGTDAAAVDPNQINVIPNIAFIDGEHTTKAVLSDFECCDKVISRDGTIVFHDYFIVYPAIREICKNLDEKKRSYLPLKLDDSVFAIFYDVKLARSDPYLLRVYLKNWLRSCSARSHMAGRLAYSQINIMAAVGNAFKWRAGLRPNCRGKCFVLPSSSTWEGHLGNPGSTSDACSTNFNRDRDIAQ